MTVSRRRLERREAERDIARELYELNGHVRAYLETMALTLMSDCGGDIEDMEQARKGRQAAAMKLLKHLEKHR